MSNWYVYVHFTMYFLYSKRDNIFIKLLDIKQ